MRLSTTRFCAGDMAKVLSTRGAAAVMASQLDRLAADTGWLPADRAFALDFEGVEIVTPSFIDELFKQMEGLEKDVVLVNMNSDVHEVVGLIRERRRL